MTSHAHEMRQVRLDLCRRLVEHARKQTTDVAEGVMFNHVSAYIDPKRYDAGTASSAKSTEPEHSGLRSVRVEFGQEGAWC